MVEGEPREGVQKIQSRTQLGSSASSTHLLVFVLDESCQPGNESRNETLLLEIPDRTGREALSPAH